jgi:hypothetical protein
MNASRLTAEYVRSILDYDPETGVFTWRERSNMRKEWNTRYAGKIAGSVNSDGYWQIVIDDNTYKGQRLAWLYMTGEWPKRHTDHIDGIRLNNSFSNLREATPSENLRNRGRPSNNTSGHKGVTWERSTGKWKARIKTHGKVVLLGRFVRIEDAAAAYANAARELHGEFARVA